MCPRPECFPNGLPCHGNCRPDTVSCPLYRLLYFAIIDCMHRCWALLLLSMIFHCCQWFLKCFPYGLPCHGTCLPDTVSCPLYRLSLLELLSACTIVDLCCFCQWILNFHVTSVSLVIFVFKYFSNVSQMGCLVMGPVVLIPSPVPFTGYHCSCCWMGVMVVDRCCSCYFCQWFLKCSALLATENFVLILSLVPFSGFHCWNWWVEDGGW